jgi:hypothetical protein
MNLSIGPSVVSRACEVFASEVEELRLDESAATDQVDSLSELGEEQQLRMQMAMDRLSKMMSTLSNVLAKHSETRDAIIGNLK